MLIGAHKDLWAAVREDLRLKLGDGRFQRWIAPLKVLSQEGNELRLGVANKFIRDWVEKTYLPAILDVIREKQSGEVTVNLVIDAALYQQHRRGCAEVLGRESAGSEPRQGAAGGGNLIEAGVSLSGIAAEKARSQEATLESFVVGSSNQIAYNAALQILEAPGTLYNPLFIHGPSGVGKTHLLKGLYRAFRSRRFSSQGQAPQEPPRGHLSVGPFCKGTYVTGEQFFIHYSSSVQDGTSRKFRERFRSLDVLFLDDVQLLVGKRKTQVEFLHTFNALVDAGRQIVLASDVPPKELKELDAGLVGRFLSGLVVGIKKPDFVTRLGILRVHAGRLPMRIEDRVLEYMAEHLRGSVRELVGALMKLDIHAQLNKGTLGFDEAREVLAEFVRDQARKIDMRKIRDVVAAHYGLQPEMLVSQSRQRHVALARQIAMYLARQQTDNSLAEIGKFFGRRNHTTVRCAEAKITRLLSVADGQLPREMRVIWESLED